VLSRQGRSRRHHPGARHHARLTRHAHLPRLSWLARLKRTEGARTHLSEYSAGHQDHQGRNRPTRP
jgi:hypothetical protein